MLIPFLQSKAQKRQEKENNLKSDYDIAIAKNESEAIYRNLINTLYSLEPNELERVKQVLSLLNDFTQLSINTDIVIDVNNSSKLTLEVINKRITKLSFV